MTRVMYGLGAVCGLVASHPNTAVFMVGLIVLCVSVAQWSAPMAGSIAGVALMSVGAWPFVARSRAKE